MVATMTTSLWRYYSTQTIRIHQKIAQFSAESPIKTFEPACVVIMPNVFLTPLIAADASRFIEAVRRSESLHKGWVEPPATVATFEQYIKSGQEIRLRFSVCNCDGVLVGIANINAIVRGAFQNGCLGFYAFAPYNGQGHMRSALIKLVTLAFSEHGFASVRSQHSTAEFALLLAHREFGIPP